MTLLGLIGFIYSWAQLGLNHSETYQVSGEQKERSLILFVLAVTFFAGAKGKILFHFYPDEYSTALSS